jgi:hypothetical protein
LGRLKHHLSEDKGSKVPKIDALDDVPKGLKEGCALHWHLLAFENGHCSGE